MRSIWSPANGKPVPALAEIPLSADDLLRALLSLSPQRRVAVLDSCGARSDSARYLIAGFDPVEIIEARAGEIFITGGDGKNTRVCHGDVLNLLDERLAEYSVEGSGEGDAPLSGACIASLSYDLLSGSRKSCAEAEGVDASEPDAVLAFYDTLVIHDYLTGQTKIVSRRGDRRLDETIHSLKDALACTPGDDDTKPSAAQSLSSSVTPDQYLTAVGQIKEHIAAGDIYQANYTQQFSCQLSQETTPETIFRRLRRDHPAPFAAFIRRREDVVVSASPERFLRVSERFVEAWPIKGTRPRGLSAEADEKLRDELLKSEKDRAENVMIVDLLRNDLGRVCRYGSVHVRELCSLEEHPTLFHLVSKVGGTLSEDVTAGDLLRAAFPCGSITGAPKIRAMEIIAETETARRGLSMGAIGYFGFDGSIDLSVAIRTMVIRDGVARFNVGGGIVADSRPRLEYEESLVKARALLRALGAESL